MRNEKVKFLDGMRGLMALSVVVCHYVEVYYPQMRYQDFYDGKVLSLFGTTPLSGLVNGSTAVQFFFLLTGFLVARSVILSPEISHRVVLAKCISRYFRLLPAVAVSTILAYVTMNLGWQCHNQILGKALYAENLGLYTFFPWNWSRAILNAVYEPFVLGGSDFVGPFWTIRYELWGYMISLLACYFLNDSRLRRIGYVVLAFVLWIAVSWNYAVFFIGVFVADLCYRKERETTVLSRYYAPVIYSKPVLYGMLILGIYLAGCPTYISEWYAFLFRIPKISDVMLQAVGMGIIVLCLMELPIIAKIFECRWLLQLGKLSFGIYAFHMPIMLVVQCGLFNLLYGRVSYNKAALGSFAIYFVVVLLAGWLSYEGLEKKIRFDIGTLLEKNECC